jgi:hypothetical protein
VAATKNTIGTDSSSVTAIYNIGIFCWAILCRRNLVRFKVCLIDILVLTLALLILLPNLGAYGAYESIAASTRILVGYYLVRSLKSTEIPIFLRYCFMLGLGTLVICLLQMPSTLRHWQTEFSRPQISGDTANPVIFGLFVGLFAIQTIATMEVRQLTGLQKLWCLSLIAISIFSLSVFGGKTNLISVCLIGLGSVLLCPLLSIKGRVLGICIFFLTVTAAVSVAPRNILAFYDLVNFTEIVEATESPLSSPVIDPANREISEGDIGVDPNNTAAVRVVLIRIGFDLFCNNILFGYGPMVNMNPHSAHAQMLFEYGIFAGVIFIVIGASVIFKLSRRAFGLSAKLKGVSWILLVLIVEVVIYNEVLGSVTNLLQYFMLLGAAVVLTLEVRAKARHTHLSRPWLQ